MKRRLTSYTRGTAAFGWTKDATKSFSVTLVRYTKEEQVVCLCLLKSLIVNINNKIDEFKIIDKKIKIKDYSQTTENVQLINNISLDLNNKIYYNFITNSDDKYLSDLTNMVILI